ncbi:MAG: orotidine-5'-phosphate decarboxylase [Chthoniobacterales bacterium]
MTRRHTPENDAQRLIVALDFPSAATALGAVRELGGEVSWSKIGLQLYTAEGPSIVRAVSETGAGIFLDLKLHDIPNTVAKAVAAAAALGVGMLTLHLSGGRRMIEAAVASCPPELLLLGVTVLTSSDDATLRETGVADTIHEQTLRLAELGAAAGIRGLIASPHEASALRARLGPEMIIITPGVRPSWSDANDQKRFTTPRQAIANGADYLVIGRPITGHPHPREAVRKIVTEMSETS